MMKKRNWLEELNKSEIELVQTTLKSSIESQQIYGATKQQAKMLLNEIDDFLWDSVCRGTPAHSDQFDIELQ